jgi:hypothetical protein
VDDRTRRAAPSAATMSFNSSIVSSSTGSVTSANDSDVREIDGYVPVPASDTFSTVPLLNEMLPAPV